MRPSLPQTDPRPGRSAGLDHARNSYTFRYDYHDIVAADALPTSEKVDLGWTAGVAKIMAELELNKLATTSKQEKVEAVAESVLTRLSGLLPEQLPAAPDLSRGHSTDKTGLESYAAIYARIDKPPIVDLWQRDEIFAWQALSGTNPVMLRRYASMDHFPVNEQHFAKAMATGTLAAAQAEGRLFVADYHELDKLPEGIVDGRQKVNFAPIVLYVSDAGGFRAVAIQTGQTPDSPLITPADGVSWKMARNTVMTAEGNYQGIISHFALCHQVMESVILSAHRQLSDRHPLMVLMLPHFRCTLLANDIAMGSLIGPDGYMERLQSPTLEASLSVATQSINAFQLTSSAPRVAFAERGIDDLEGLPNYPARDDAVAVWAAVESWAESYVRTYYAADEDVRDDAELQAWVREMGADDGGRLNGLDQPQAVKHVVDLVAQILFRCTCHHASINYSSFPLFSFAPNVQAASFGPGPTGGTDDTQAAYEAMIPPWDIAFEGFTLFYEITMQLTKLGDYPQGHFVDDQVAPMLKKHQDDLAVIEASIHRKNATRLMAYPWMMPSRVPLSIHV